MRFSKELNYDFLTPSPDIHLTRIGLVKLISIQRHYEIFIEICKENLSQSRHYFEYLISNQVCMSEFIVTKINLYVL